MTWEVIVTQSNQMGDLGKTFDSLMRGADRQAVGTRHIISSRLCQMGVSRQRTDTKTGFE
jgi:hypothetical protein